MDFLITVGLFFGIYWLYAAYLKEKDEHLREKANALVEAKVPWNPRLLNFDSSLKHRGIFALIPASYVHNLYDKDPLRFIKMLETYEADKGNGNLSFDSSAVIESIMSDIEKSISASDLKGIEYSRESLYGVIRDYHNLKRSDISA